MAHQILLPSIIQHYFESDRQTAEAVVACFTEHGVVRDEDHEYMGHKAILGWKQQASTQYEYYAEPLSIEMQNGKHVVLARVEGNFPGSPINLHYAFQITDEKIEVLEITV
ncbi:nuclear transport factor 2 family protein [Acinetobacter pittii]|uniref:nuclear transport factor 2 family protein n=1 Tax=Acinetobacter pittii TaxID=48296 RepID=UPI001EFC9485|nr:nuclear transport factor 2 family protein [Acinetobacter pittii]MCG9492050.1 nuclear transport factor 2 family protein [Acinetobacter pittii]